MNKRYKNTELSSQRFITSLLEFEHNQTERSHNMIKVLAEFGNEQEQSILLKLPTHVMQGLSLDGETVSTKHLLGALMLMEREAELHQPDEISLSERIDLLDAIYNPNRAVTEKPVNRKA